MARKVNEQDYEEKRNEILDAAQRLVFTRGYEKMTIQGILADLHISNGAFYHYFDTKQAVLEALIERMQAEAERPILPIVADPQLPALEKLQRFFATLDQSRTTQKAFISDLARVWFADSNAIIREKVDEAIVLRRAPLLNAIVRQGIAEGVLSTPYPDRAGELILALTRGLGNTLARLMLAAAERPGEPAAIAEIASVYAAYSDAIERVVGAPAGFLYGPDPAEIRSWLAP